MKPNQSLHLTIKQPGISKTEPIKQLAVFPQIPTDTQQFAQYIANLIVKELHCTPSSLFQEDLRKEAIDAINNSNILLIHKENNFIQITLSLNDPTS